MSSKAAPAGARGWRLAPSLVPQPLWLLGAGAGLASFACQALALNDSQLSVVPPLFVTELVFALLLRRLWIHDTVRAAAWGSAALTCVALAAFLVVAEPRGGRSAVPARAWVGSLAVFGGAVVGLTVVCGRSGSPGRRAGLYATAAAVVWALEATFIKAATETLTGEGIPAMLTDWPVYTTVIGGIVGTVLTQAALHVGPLSVSQQLLVVVDPIVSIVLSVWVFAERFTDSPAAIAVGALSFILVIIGVVLLTATGPRGRPAPTPPASASPRRQQVSRHRRPIVDRRALDNVVAGQHHLRRTTRPTRPIKPNDHRSWTRRESSRPTPTLNPGRVMAFRSSGRSDTRLDLGRAPVR